MLVDDSPERAQLVEERLWAAGFEVVAVIASGCHAAEPGLVAHWDFDQGSGEFAPDVTGNGHDAALTNVEWVPSPRGYALRFDSGDDLAAYGFFVCVEDLEDELIRALGTSAVVDVVGREGELGQLHTFQQQPFQRARPLHDQLRRFAGTKSGRKVRLAAALAAQLPLEGLPAPLVDVLTLAASSVAVRDPGDP